MLGCFKTPQMGSMEKYNDPLTLPSPRPLPAFALCSLIADSCRSITERQFADRQFADRQTAGYILQTDIQTYRQIVPFTFQPAGRRTVTEKMTDLHLQPVVMDVGSLTTKVGFAGGTAPKYTYDSILGRIKHRRVIPGGGFGEGGVGEGEGRG